MKLLLQAWNANTAYELEVALAIVLGGLLAIALLRYVGSALAGALAKRSDIPFHRVARDLHAIARNRTLTGLALGYTPDGGIDFGLSRKEIGEMTGAPYGILLHATARVEKEWPEASWIALGRALSARASSLLVPWGTEAEHARSGRIAAALANARVAERQSLDRMAALIAGASFVIGVDTGLIHLAAALGVPLVAIR